MRSLVWIKSAFAVALAWLIMSSTAGLAAPPTEAEKTEFFEKQVRPLLQGHCFKCHGDGKAKGGLSLGSRKAVLAGGDGGPAVNFDQPATSLLLRAVNYSSDDLQMPPKEKLPAAQIKILAQWVEMGLPYSGETVTVIEPREAGHAKKGPPAVDEQAMKFWSFVPVRRPAAPSIKDRAWATHAIDAFILAKLEAANLKPAAPAARTALLRRAYFDLIGLPPTPEEVRVFLADEAPDAYEKVIDRLLAMPQYGEKWGRHWLDLVRFAETNSFERDNPKPNAWRYRDYVIGAFNSDKPYDQFIREQIAGDEIVPSTTEGVIATGFYRLGAWDDEPTDRLQARYDELDDIVATTSQVFLGLTMNCARCHDHKIDPVPQKDYYRLLAFFHNIAPYQTTGPNILTPVAPADQVKALEDEKRSLEQRKEDLRTRIEHFEHQVAGKLSPEEKQKVKSRRQREEVYAPHVLQATNEDELRHYRQLWAQLREAEASKPSDLPQALSVKETSAAPAPTFVLVRGNASSKGVEVQPGFPAVLKTPDPIIAPATSGQKTTGRRTVLARWLADPGNPLTARVMANRLWHYHFGRGIVRSPNDFGYGGDKPTHPELLDYLASELVEGGWRLKRLHKTIMLSNTYRMSSAANPEALAKDPANDLLWRFDMRRLTAEEIRDATLLACGTLNKTMGGPGIYPEIPPVVLAGQSRPGEGWGKSSFEEQCRRSVYVHVKRSLSVPMLGAMDAPDTDFSCPARFTTTQATQSLLMLNSAAMNRHARDFSSRLKKECGDDPARQVERALELALSRPIRQPEVARGLEFMNRLVVKHGAGRDVALEQFALMVLNLNEFVYID